ncbi:MAG: hypothetical protein Unbinned2514contig1000_40 [Prokaryotic dsDNA virus sp.]|nr:MAG: hypothetical protein Unbinned2514contig1000_40 [Prokaryotic dsDNA virus sp.]
MQRTPKSIKVVPLVNPHEFWFRVNWILGLRSLDLRWLAGEIGRRECFLTFRSRQNTIEKSQRKIVLHALGLTEGDLALPLEIFAGKFMREIDERKGTQRQVRISRQEGFDDLDSL